MRTRREQIPCEDWTLEALYEPSHILSMGTLVLSLSRIPYIPDIPYDLRQPLVC